jgi:carboxylesterase type B
MVSNETAETFDYQKISWFQFLANRSVLQSRDSMNQWDFKNVYTQFGYIRGEETKKGFSFRGIPYAVPPIGNLRFKNPVPHTAKWPDNREFKTYGPKCAQFNHFGYKFEGEEDCLTLNVFVSRGIMEAPVEHGSPLMFPVVVFIHGGGFMHGGSKDYGEKYFFEDQRMILVTINYRLGVLGFLSAEDRIISGNFGMKDQVEALKWVKTNIIGFRGNKRYITIAGFSAGAASVHLHFLSPLTRGLFTNGISHSGNALDPWVMQEKAKEKTLEIAKRFDCRVTPKKDWMLTCLQSIDVEALVMYSSHFQRFLYNPFSPFGVVVEQPDPTAYMYNKPRDIMKVKRPSYQDKPWILSLTEDEGLYPAAEFIDKNILADIDRNWMVYSPYLLDLVSLLPDPEVQASLARAVRREYFNNNPIDMSTIFDLIRVKRSNF